MNTPTTKTDGPGSTIQLPGTPNPHIMSRIQSKLDKVRMSHSAFWMGGDVEAMIEKVEVGSLEYIDRLRKIQHATANFVRIVTGEDISVSYSSGQQSYTDGKSVVLSADIDPSKLDSLVGTALHEAAHCVKSKELLAFLPKMSGYFDMMVKGRDIVRHAMRLGIPLLDPIKQPMAPAVTPNNKDSVIAHVRMVMNVLEDRRIDLWMYQTAPGYRPYYESMYDEYWHSEKIDAALKDPQFRDRAVYNYILFVINMTNTNFDAQAMPGLAEIRRIADLSVKGLEARGDEDPGWQHMTRAFRGMTYNDPKTWPRLIADAVRIVEIIYEHSIVVESPNKPDKGDLKDQSGGLGDDLPNMDAGGRIIRVSAKELKEILDKQRKFLEHELGKKPLDASIRAQLDQLEKTKASIVDVEGDFLPRNVKARVIIYRNITKEIVLSNEFPFRADRYNTKNHRNVYMVEALRSGISMGAILAHRIRVMQDEFPLVFNRQEHGKLDKRRVAQLGAGATDVFAFTVIERKKPVNLWLDVDFSGSMSGEKAQNAMAVAVAIAYAAEKTRTLNVTIAIRDGGSDCARVAILYDSRTTTFNRLREIIPHIDVSGGTPESLAFEAIKDEMMKMYKNERKFFINLSDGEPGHSFSYKGKSYSYGGDAAYKHTRMLMNDFRNAGIEVMAYYIGRSGYEHPGFKSMYGKDARFIDPKSIGQLISTVNKLLMTDAAP